MPQYDIEIRNTNVASDLSDCVIVLDFAKASADCQAWLYANAKSDGTDIRVYLSDGVTQLNHDLISFSKPGTDQAAGRMRILIPNVDSSANTPLRLDCDGSRSDGSTTATYPSSWKYYSPFDGNANDRTSNANNGTVNGASSASGQVGNSLLFNASESDYVQIGNGAISPGTGVWTLELWMKTTMSGVQGELFREYGAIANNTISLHQKPDNKLYFVIRDGAGSLMQVASSSATTHRDGNWHLISAVRTSQTSIALYVDGAQVASTSGTLNDVDVSDGRGPEFGRFSDQTAASDQFYFTGSIDEPVIALASFSAARSRFRYHNESSSDNEIDYIGEVVVASSRLLIRRRRMSA